MLVPAEDRLDARTPEHRQQMPNHRGRVRVLRAGAERRVVRERDTPRSPGRLFGRGERRVEEGGVVLMLEEAVAEEQRVARRVYTDELHVRAVVETVHQPRPD